jgi:hypothetical protein
MATEDHSGWFSLTNPGNDPGRPLKTDTRRNASTTLSSTKPRRHPLDTLWESTVSPAMLAAAVKPQPAPVPARVERLIDVAEPLVEQFLAVYRAAFAPLETRAAARQSLTDDEFREEMRDPRVTKLVAFDDAGEAGSMAIVATDLAVVPWISVPYYAQRFPEQYARGAVYYVNAAVVRPDRQGGPWAKVVLDALYRFVADNRAVMAFDSCGFNVDVIKLVESTARAAHRIAHVETVELDRQHYYAFDMAGGPR